MQVRRATAADAPAIGRAHAASWRAAYRHLGPDFLASIVDQERIDLWSRVLHEGAVVFVAPADSPHAFVNVMASHDEDALPETGEVASIYAAPDAWGTGAGRALMDAAVAELAAMGFTEATLWVLDDNPRARRFYEIAGWSIDGAAKDQEWRGVTIHEVRYRRALR